MNIFKILANGDGTINEANISAFLGYLLDPYQDHGLGHEFLKRFLDLIHPNVKINYYKFDYEIEFEQAFRKDDKKKEIVDIVIACFPIKKQNLKESITKDSIESKRELERIYLIENKVNTSSIKKGQMQNQFDSTILTLTLDKDKVFSVYLTPDDKSFHSEFKTFGGHNRSHFVWAFKNELIVNKGEIELDVEKNNEKILIQDSIYKIIKKLIEEESKGEIETINSYTKHTLISFIKFIENEFKSELQEKKDKQEGKFQKDIFEDFDIFFEKYKDNLDENANSILKQFNEFIRDKHIDLEIVHSKTHPISISSGEVKIFSCSKKNRKMKYEINNLNKTNKKMEILKILNDREYKYKEVNSYINCFEDFNIEGLKEFF